MDSPLPLLSPAPSRADADADAFEHLVREHAGMVFATARRVTGNDASAQDVMQETFLELARGRHGAVEHVGAWLHRVAWRKACNAIRGESRRRRHEQAAAAELSPATAEATWEDLEPLIDEALEKLPAPLRGALVSHFLEGRTQQELAARLGVSQSTISRQLDAGLHELRTCLRRRGVALGAALPVLLSTHAAEAAPPGLPAALAKLAASSSTPAAASVTASTILAMSTSKILLAAAALAAISAPLVVLRQRDTQPNPPKTAQAAPAQAHPAAPQQAGTPTLAAAPATRHYRPAPVSAQMRQKVEGILRRHHGMTKEQLMQSEEIQKLMERSVKLMDRVMANPTVQEAMTDLNKMSGLEHGVMTIDLEFEGPKGRAWLEAAVAEDEERMEEWFINRLNGSIFEFAIEPGLAKSSEGIAFTPDTRASKEDAPATDED